MGHNSERFVKSELGHLPATNQTSDEWVRRDVGGAPKIQGTTELRYSLATLFGDLSSQIVFSQEE